nr:MAG TPA: hypothetical protein [Caudoviricetes sp.]
MLFGECRNESRNYPGYRINRNYASPKETLSCGGQSGTKAMTSKVIPLAVRVTFTSASENVYGHRVSINGSTITEIQCCNGKSYDITLDLEAIYGWEWLLAQTGFVFGHYDWYQMPTTIKVVRWAEKSSGIGNKYEVVNLFDARQSPGSVSGSKTFEKPVFVDKIYMSWFRSYSDYKATVTVKVTLEDDTQQTIYSVSNSGVVGGENAVLNVNNKIKAISFEMFSGSVGGNGIGYQVTFVALK